MFPGKYEMGRKVSVEGVVFSGEIGNQVRNAICTLHRERRGGGGSWGNGKLCEKSARRGGGISLEI